MKFSAMMFAAAFAAVSVVSTASIAQDDPVKVRQDLMEGVGDSAKVVGPMLQGKAPFNAEMAKAALQTIVTNTEGFETHFPDGSFEGDTEALPAIAANRADFDAKVEKFHADAVAAVAAVDQGEDAFKASAGAMFGNCKACHELYRKPS